MTYITDPLAETEHQALPGLVWKYPHRALLLVTLDCPSHCAFCFRKNIYSNFHRASNSEVVDFIQTHPQISEFIFSGGEPLTAPTDIVALTQALSVIPSMKIFRIHTRLPITFPQQVDSAVINLPLTVSQPIYTVLHINTPTELTPQTIDVIKKLRQAGHILLSHTVFLKNINDSVSTLTDLFTSLTELGVKPYSLFHCDHLEHTTAFEVTLEKEIDIVSKLRSQLSGLAFPLHLIDSSSGHGKIPVPTNYWDFDLSHYRDFEDTPLTV